MIEEYDLSSDELRLRKVRAKPAVGEGKWELEASEPLRNHYFQCKHHHHHHHHLSLSFLFSLTIFNRYLFHLKPFIFKN